MWIPPEEYSRIVSLIPLPCVDLVIKNKYEEILLVKRYNEPAKGQWWTPGGRVLFGETRKEAAVRKLKEECGIFGIIEREAGTFDLLLTYINAEKTILSHGISTFFIINSEEENIKLDKQSVDFKWVKQTDYLNHINNVQLNNILKLILTS